MIRGLFQNAVIIQNPRGGKIFSQAIFILRPESACTDRELVEEAQRIIEENTSVRKRRKAYK
ncbi:MAG: hypothetical protein J6B86_00120 [Clostridia bacterium]|nr:hypothetical protein [Clostridia bacterium]